MDLPISYFTVDGHLFKATLNRIYEGEQSGKPCLMTEIQVVEVEFCV